MILTYPVTWSVVGEGVCRASAVASASENLSVFTFADINLLQGVPKPNEEKEPAWITVECADPAQSVVTSQIEVGSNARFVEIYAGDKYLVTAKGVASLSSEGGLTGFHFSEQLQQVSCRQLRLKFLSIKSGSGPMAGGVAGSGVLLHLTKLSVSVANSAQGPGSVTRSADASIPAIPVMGMSSAAIFEMMARQPEQQQQQQQQQQQHAAPSQQSASVSSSIPDMMMMKSMLLADMERLLDRKLAPLYTRLDGLQARLDERLQVKVQVEQEVKQHHGDHIDSMVCPSACSSSEGTLPVAPADGPMGGQGAPLLRGGSRLNAIFDIVASAGGPKGKEEEEEVAVAVPDSGAEADLALKGDMRDLMKLLR